MFDPTFIPKEDNTQQAWKGKQVHMKLRQNFQQSWFVQISIVYKTKTYIAFSFNSSRLTTQTLWNWKECASCGSSNSMWMIFGRDFYWKNILLISWSLVTKHSGSCWPSACTWIATLPKSLNILNQCRLRKDNEENRFVQKMFRFITGRCASDLNEIAEQIPRIRDNLKGNRGSLLNYSDDFSPQEQQLCSFSRTVSCKRKSGNLTAGQAVSSLWKAKSWNSATIIWHIIRDVCWGL